MAHHRLPRSLRSLRHMPWRVLLGAATILALLIGGTQLSQTIVTRAEVTSTGFDRSLMGAGAPGSLQSYTHTLSNASSQPQTFQLSAASSKGFSVAVDPPSITIAGGGTANITLQVTIPDGTDAGVLDVTTLTATNTPPAAPLVAKINDTTLASTDTALKIPPLLTGSLIDGTRVYSLTAQSSTTEFWPGVETPTYGYNGSYLAPTLMITKSEQIQLNVTNNLTEVTTTHWHGLHLPPEADGGPHQPIEPGTTWSPAFTVLNEASTAWFHPHPHEVEHEHDHALASGDSGATTGIQVQRGMAGMIIVRDAESSALGLPQTYGVDEFPIVLQDRLFNDDGTFHIAPNMIGQRKGDAFLVNGTLAGHLQAPAQLVRLHLLNGSNFRFYNLGFSDNRSFHQIASDAALLNTPVERSRLIIAPGERMEIVVDLSDAQGKSIYLTNYSGELGDSLIPNHTADAYDRSNSVLMTVQVGVPNDRPALSLPTTLNDIVRIDRSKITVENRLTLMIPPSINGRFFEMETINFTSTLDTVELWSIFNQSEEPHPIHIHGTPFQVLARDAPPPIDGKPLPDGGTLPPNYEMGWKDTLIVYPGERVDLIKISTDYTDPDSPFMYHCHLLEHEDDGMMGQYIVRDSFRLYQPLMIAQ
jgi:FtsP/CotA-like multicopper oxidase with cupredoxin domain